MRSKIKEMLMKNKIRALLIDGEEKTINEVKKYFVFHKHLLYFTAHTNYKTKIVKTPEYFMSYHVNLCQKKSNAILKLRLPLEPVYHLVNYLGCIYFHLNLFRYQV